MAAQIEYYLCASSNPNFRILGFTNAKNQSVYQRYKYVETTDTFKQFSGPFVLSNEDESYILYEYTEDFEGIEIQLETESFPEKIFDFFDK